MRIPCRPEISQQRSRSHDLTAVTIRSPMPTTEQEASAPRNGNRNVGDRVAETTARGVKFAIANAGHDERAPRRLPPLGPFTSPTTDRRGRLAEHEHLAGE